MRLGDMLRLYIAAYNLPLRELAKEIRVSAATLSRFQRGEDISGVTFARILTWVMK